MLKQFPRLSTILLSYAVAFMIFGFLGPDFFGRVITPFGIFGMFVAGMMYTYSFTTSIGAILLVPFGLHYPAGLVAVIGGIGALFGDLTIFKFIRHDLNKEVRRLASCRCMRRLGATPLFRKAWFQDLLGVIVIASPVPDEIGIAIMSNAKIDTTLFSLLTFIADMVGIYLLVSAVRMVY